jgi:hypothetical protein
MKMGSTGGIFGSVEVDPQRSQEAGPPLVLRKQARMSTWSGRVYWNLELSSRFGGEHA